MESQFWSTGPALIFVRSSGTADLQPVHLGTCETRPLITHSRAFTPIFTDEGGSAIPIDRIYEGREATVTGILNRFHMDELVRQMNRPSVVGTRLLERRPGRDWVDTYGALMTREKLTSELWVFFPKILGVEEHAGAIKGYHFFSAFLESPDRIEPGSRELQIGFVFRCQRVRKTGAGGVLNPPPGGDTVDVSNTSLDMYDHDMSALDGVGIG